MTTRPTRALIVEANEDDAALISSYLSGPPGAGDPVIVSLAPRLSTACLLLARQSFDVVLLDLAVPQTTGLDGFFKLTALRPGVPVIILTGKRDEAIAAEAVKHGAQDYFIKGSPECLLLRRAIRYAIERKRLLALLDAPARAEPSPLEPEPDAALSVVEARNHFLSRISHEMRNTLATMKTAAYCLKDDSREKLSPGQAQMVDMISRNIDRQTRIVENILDMARLRSGKLRLEFREASPSAIIADLADEFRMSRRGRQLQVRVADDLPAIVCDPDLIAQVLRNLLDNALRYAKEKIAIEASRTPDGGVRVSVTDDGAGIPEDRLVGLFTQFHRLDTPENAPGPKGTGLGLAICREIIEGHHGRIRAENAAGSGARFSFDLPVRRAPEPVAAAPRPAPEGSHLLHK